MPAGTSYLTMAGFAEIRSRDKLCGPRPAHWSGLVGVARKGEGWGISGRPACPAPPAHSLEIPPPSKHKTKFITLLSTNTMRIAWRRIVLASLLFLHSLPP